MSSSEKPDIRKGDLVHTKMGPPQGMWLTVEDYEPYDNPVSFEKEWHYYCYDDYGNDMWLDLSEIDEVCIDYRCLQRGKSNGGS